MAGAPWDFYVVPSTITTVYMKYAGADDSTAITVTNSGGPEGGFFSTNYFVETNTVEIWADGYQRTTVIVGASPITLTQSSGSEIPTDTRVEITTLNTTKNAIKNAIESKGVTIEADTPFSEYADAIEDIVELKGETKTITPTTSQQTIIPSTGKNGITEVTVDAVTAAIDSNIIPANIKVGTTILGVEGTNQGGTLQAKTLTVGEGTQTEVVLTPDTGNYGLSSVTVDMDYIEDKLNSIINGPIPENNVSYEDWSKYVFTSYDDPTVDTTKYYMIEALDEFPSSGWTNGDFRNVRSIRFVNNYFLGRSGQTYDNIRFDNLETIGTNQYNAGATSFMRYRTDITLSFPKLRTIMTNGYNFAQSNNCDYSFPLLTIVSSNYFGANSTNSSFSFPSLATISSSNAFANCTNCTFSFPELVSVSSSFLAGYNGTITVNLPKITTISTSYPSSTSTNKITYNLTTSNALNIGTLPSSTNANKGSIEINIPNATELYLQLSNNSTSSGNTYYSTVTLNAPNVISTGSGSWGFQYIGEGNIYLIQSILNNLQVINGYYTFAYNRFTEFTLPNVHTINSSYTFYSSNSLTKLNLPKCTTISNSSAFSNSSLTEIHFASANQAAIEASSGYANKWGRGSNCTVYFDL